MAAAHSSAINAIILPRKSHKLGITYTDRIGHDELGRRLKTGARFSLLYQYSTNRAGNRSNVHTEDKDYFHGDRNG